MTKEEIHLKAVKIVTDYLVSDKPGDALIDSIEAALHEAEFNRQGHDFMEQRKDLNIYSKAGFIKGVLEGILITTNTQEMKNAISQALDYVEEIFP